MLVTLPAGHRPGDDVLVLAHGAGTNMRHRFLESFATAVAALGLAVVRFDFPYSEAGGRRPDPGPVLEARWVDVLAAVRSDPALAPRRVFGAGKSMGGRIATMVAARAPGAFDAIALLGYPLHPPRKTDRLRDRHLPAAARSTRLLFLQGTRDDLCRLDLLRPIVDAIGAALHVVEDADHSFAVLKRTGRTPADVTAELARTAVAFLREDR